MFLENVTKNNNFVRWWFLLFRHGIVHYANQEVYSWQNGSGWPKRIYYTCSKIRL